MLWLRQLFKKKNFKYIQINFLPQFSWGLLVVHRGCTLLIHGISCLAHFPWTTLVLLFPKQVKDVAVYRLCLFVLWTLLSNKFFFWLLISLVFLILQLKYSFLRLIQAPRPDPSPPSPSLLLSSLSSWFVSCVALTQNSNDLDLLLAHSCIVVLLLLTSCNLKEQGPCPRLFLPNLYLVYSQLQCEWQAQSFSFCLLSVH